MFCFYIFGFLLLGFYCTCFSCVKVLRQVFSAATDNSATSDGDDEDLFRLYMASHLPHLAHLWLSDEQHICEFPHTLLGFSDSQTFIRYSLIAL